MSAKIQITEAERTQYLTVLDEILTEETYTMYGVAKVLNRVLVANGMEAKRPQMMYNYARNGLLVRGEKIFGESLRDLNKSEVAEFVIRYALRNGCEIKINAPQNPNQLELDLGI